MKSRQFLVPRMIATNAPRLYTYRRGAVAYHLVQGVETLSKDDKTNSSHAFFFVSRCDKI